jgi:subtilisin family serine protease
VPSIALAIGMLVLSGFAGRAAAPPPDTVLGPHVSERVQAQVASEGHARVIVELRLAGGPLVPEGQLSSLAAVLAQRGDIASTRTQVLSRLQGRNYALVRQFDTIPYLALEVGPDALAELAAATLYVMRVVEDERFDPVLFQSVPRIGADQAWNAGYDGTGMTIAILDTGVDKTHPFLAGKVVEEACFSSALGPLCPNGQPTQLGPGTGVNCTVQFNSPCWHGTHVAGIAAGNGTNVPGAPPGGVAKGAKIMAVQIFYSTGTSIQTSVSSIQAGLERVYICATSPQQCSGTYNFAAVNLSVGGMLYSSNCDFGNPLTDPINNLRSVGIATVAASGNNGSPNKIATPACISSAVSVASTTNDTANAVSSFSNVAPFLSLFAPGDPILSSYAMYVGGGFRSFSGTSMATPHVSGAFAILKQAAAGTPPGTVVTNILNALQQTGMPITSSTRRVQTNAALAALAPVQQLSVIRGGSGTGAVTSGDGSINCGSMCSATFGAPTAITLTATPATGSFFKQWGGACSGTVPTCSITVNGNQSVTATFSESFTDGSGPNAPVTTTTTVIKAVHVVELRTAIDNLRAVNGIGAYGWTDPTLTPTSTLAKRIHFLDLRTALAPVCAAFPGKCTAYTDATIDVGQTPIKAAHLNELRANVRALE